MCPKTSFSSAATVETSVALAVAWFNDGSIAVARVLEEMGLPVGRYTVATLKKLDHERASHAARKSSEEGRKSRKMRRIREGIQDLHQEEEGVVYAAGVFGVE